MPLELPTMSSMKSYVKAKRPNGRQQRWEHSHRWGRPAHRRGTSEEIHLFLVWFVANDPRNGGQR